jgi:large subunit ribosomal protein L24
MISNTINIKKDDKVKIIAGKDKGKVGKVLKVIGKKNRLLVENINIVKRHTKPNAQNRQGGILESEAPIHWSNVMLMCNKCIEPVRAKTKTLDDGKKVRYCGKCNEIIDA